MQQICSRTVAELQQICSRTVAELPQNCRRTAAELPQNCRRTAAELPQNCRRTAAELPQNCRRTVAELQQNCRSTAAEQEHADINKRILLKVKKFCRNRNLKHERKWVIIIITITIIRTRKALNRESEKREGKGGLKDSKGNLEIIVKFFAEIRRKRSVCCALRHCDT